MGKGSVQPGGAMSNQFRLVVPGFPEIYFTRIGELSAELVKAEMADGTWQSTGKVKPGETEVDQYLHHDGERAAMEAWWTACQAGAPGHKLDCELYFQGSDGQPRASYLLDGVIVTSRKTPELNRAQDGEGVLLTWGLAFDAVIPL